MRGNKIILAAWSALAVFCVIQVIWGPLGVLQTNQLQTYEKKLDKRLADLQDENESLWRQYDSLRISEGAVRLQARQLGWFAKGDIPVRVLSGPALGSGFHEEVWRAYRPHLPTDNLSLFFRSAWFLLFFFFYLVFFFVDKLRAMPARPQTFRPFAKPQKAGVETAGVQKAGVQEPPVEPVLAKVQPENPKTTKLLPDEIPRLPTIRVWEKQAPEPIWRAEFPQIRSEH